MHMCTHLRLPLGEQRGWRHNERRFDGEHILGVCWQLAQRPLRRRWTREDQPQKLKRLAQPDVIAEHPSARLEARSCEEAQGELARPAVKVEETPVGCAQLDPGRVEREPVGLLLLVRHPCDAILLEGVQAALLSQPAQALGKHAPIA